MVLGAIQKPRTPFSYEYQGMTDIQEEELFENGCIAFLPEEEEQASIFFDIYGCVSFSFNNPIETLIARKIELEKFKADNIKWLKKHFYKNDKPNISDRDLVVLSGTDPDKGNDGWSVFLTAKNKGLVPEEIAPFDLRNKDYAVNNKLNYYSYQRSKKAQEIADEFKKRFEIKAEWVNRDHWEEASKKGCLQVYTKAWYKRNGKYYNPEPGTSGHAIQLAQLSELKIFDSYDPFIKEMEKIEDFYPLALKINIFDKSMEKPKLENNSLILMVTGPGDVGLFLDGRIIKDSPALILTTWLARNSKNGVFTGASVRSITQEQWDLFDKTDLKGNKL